MARITCQWLVVIVIELYATVCCSFAVNIFSRDDLKKNNSTSELGLNTVMRTEQNSVQPVPLYLNEVHACDGSPFAIIFIHSAPRHFEQRLTIRKTWGSVGMDAEYNTKILFIVGLPTANSSVSLLDIQEENDSNDDILLVNVIDVYKNLTLKSVAMLDWTNIHCGGVRYIIKSDDDTFINTPLLIRDLQDVVHTEFVMGDIIAGARPIRDRKSKYFTPATYFNNSMYPTYLSGAAYIISGDIVPSLSQAAKTTELFWLEDVYITGILARQVRAKHVYNRKFGFRIQTIIPCRLQNIIALHRISPKEMWNAWTIVTNNSLTC